MNRRGLFRFLAGAPLGVLGAGAVASQVAGAGEAWRHVGHLAGGSIPCVGGMSLNALKPYTSEEIEAANARSTARAWIRAMQEEIRRSRDAYVSGPLDLKYRAGE